MFYLFAEAFVKMNLRTCLVTKSQLFQLRATEAGDRIILFIYFLFIHCHTVITCEVRQRQRVTSLLVVRMDRFAFSRPIIRQYCVRKPESVLETFFDFTKCFSLVGCYCVTVFFLNFSFKPSLKLSSLMFKTEV